MATEASQETILEETDLAAASMEAAAPEDEDKADAESVTESVTASVTETSLMAPVVPTDYEPPRYFTNPDPEPMSSSSWFKLWSRKSENKDSKGGESDTEMECSDPDLESLLKPEKESFSIFSGRLFPRRNSESCMSSICEKEVDVHSRSLH